MNLNHEDIENLNKPIASNKIKLVIKTIKKAQFQIVSQVNYTKHLKKS